MIRKDILDLQSQVDTKKIVLHEIGSPLLRNKHAPVNYKMLSNN